MTSAESLTVRYKIYADTSPQKMTKYYDPETALPEGYAFTSYPIHNMQSLKKSKKNRAYQIFHYPICPISINLPSIIPIIYHKMPSVFYVLLLLYYCFLSLHYPKRSIQKFYFSYLYISECGQAFPVLLSLSYTFPLPLCV